MVKLRWISLLFVFRRSIKYLGAIVGDVDNLLKEFVLRNLLFSQIYKMINVRITNNRAYLFLLSIA
jgi:hypothetical protein